MAELLFFAVNVVNVDPVKDAKCYKRGDVIIACADGWNWSQIELSNPSWRIAKVPDMTISDAQPLLVAEPGDPAVSPLLQRRAVNLNLDSPLLAAVATILADATRTTQTVDLTKSLVASITVTKPPLTSPNVIG